MSDETVGYLLGFCYRFEIKGLDMPWRRPFVDCTGTTRHQPDANNPNLVIEEKLVILDNGNEIRSITVTPEQFFVTTVAKRVKRR